MPDEPAPIQDANAPFSGNPDLDNDGRRADFLLRSSDSVDFHVHREVLKYVRIPGRKQSFQRTGAGWETGVDPPGAQYGLVPASLSRTPLGPSDSLASTRFPATCSSTSTRLSGNFSFRACKKLLNETLTKPTLLDGHPHRVFSIAWLRNFPDLARRTAIFTVKYPVYPPDSPPVGGWPKLYQFHYACNRAAEHIAKTNRTPQLLSLEDSVRIPGTFVWWFDEHIAECKAIFCTGAWFARHIDRLVAQLRVRPRGETARRAALEIAPADCAVIEACPACSQRAAVDLSHFADKLAEKTDDSNASLAAARGKVSTSPRSAPRGTAPCAPNLVDVLAVKYSVSQTQIIVAWLLSAEFLPTQDRGPCWENIALLKLSAEDVARATALERNKRIVNQRGRMGSCTRGRRSSMGGDLCLLNMEYVRSGYA
ncbi:hypothetical protein B0H17DRAFT_1133266 [Mycena rosella]|uniref:BTB domain-containing protein n=1 Tax=Mycena rosella TaxID=1033263 RepID=A0AAD7DJF4_MYCRO|nr:hypothetical protein B0H17DRAFT_1133266 [Mycena rosella]